MIRAVSALLIITALSASASAESLTKILKVTDYGNKTIYVTLKNTSGKTTIKTVFYQCQVIDPSNGAPGSCVSVVENIPPGVSVDSRLFCRAKGTILAEGCRIIRETTE